MIRRRIAVVAVLATVLAACGGGSSSDGRDRNIAGGGEIAVKSTPYQVALALYDVVNGKQASTGGACGGSIIAPSWVLTAEHCMRRDAAGVIHPDAIYIGSGDPSFGRSLNSFSTRFGQAVYVARNSGGPNPNLDLALIKVDRPFVYSDTVQPISLPVGLDRSAWPAMSSVGFISGWGNDLNGTSQANLRGVGMMVNSEIASQYCLGDPGEYLAYFWGTFDPAKHLCLQRPNTSAPAAACKGDSGGPFAITVGDKPVVAGVASLATAPRPNPGEAPNYCTGTVPNLYVRVTAGLDWILPGKVRDLSARTTNGRVDLSWSPPAALPVNPITDYQIDVRKAGTTAWSTLNDGVSTDAAASITDLTDGDVLEFRVSGLNDVNSKNAEMREYETMTVTVGTPPTTVESTTTTALTTTTLPLVTTTLSPSTTARAVVVGSKPTTTIPSIASTVVPVPAATSTVPASPLTTVAAPSVAPTLPSGQKLQVVQIVDPQFEKPSLPPDMKTPVVANSSSSPVVAAGPQPVVGATWSATDVATSGNVTVPTGALVSVTAKSSKFCKSSGSSIVLTAKGTCKVAVSVKVGSGKPKNKTVSIKVS